MFSVAVVVARRLLNARPHLLFREATVSFAREERKDRESGSSSHPKHG